MRGVADAATEAALDGTVVAPSIAWFTRLRTAISAKATGELTIWLWAKEGRGAALQQRPSDNTAYVKGNLAGTFVMRRVAPLRTTG